MSDAFEPEHPDWNTVEVLAARVDELMVLAGAVKAALTRTRTAQDTLGQDPEQLTEDQIVEVIQSLILDMDYIRALAQIERNRASDALLELEQTQLEREELRALVESVQTQLEDWKEENSRLQTHRDELRDELLTLQSSRWMKLGRSLGVHRN